MDAINNIDPHFLLNAFVSLAIAFVLGSAIGVERQIRQRTAGLRTNTLVSVGAAAFIVLANRLEGHSGIEFL
jgi:putative Mg2+ transporter-C (MgtC) family protein